MIDLTNAPLPNRVQLKRTTTLDDDEPTNKRTKVIIDLADKVAGGSTAPQTINRTQSNASNANVVAEEPAPEVRTIDDSLNFLANLFPDACPIYLGEQLRMDIVVEEIVEKLLTNPDYPKRGSSSKSNENKKQAEVKVDDEANGIDRYNLTRSQLVQDFLWIPVNFINTTLSKSSNDYFKSYLTLHKFMTAAIPNYEIPNNAVPPRPNQATNTKFRFLQNAREIVALDHALSQEFSNTRLAIQMGFESFEDAKAARIFEAEGGNEEPDAEAEVVPDDDCEMECGCCFCEYPLSQMTQCEDGHLFCLECAKRAAEVIIGLRKTQFKCLDSASDCKYGFEEKEIRRFLGEKTWEGYQKLRMEEEVRMAEIDGLESCPFCSFAMIMLDTFEENKLFVCQNEECKVVSCRNCKKKNHLPRTCEEVQKDTTLNAQHQIEEAMSLALLRECPKCKKKFFKEDGCNKMTCTCGQIMCYVCRAPIKGYDHFHRQNNNSEIIDGKCPLFDNTAQRNTDDVKLAAERAMEEAKATNKEIKVDDIKIDIPVAPPPKPANQFAFGGGGVGGGCNCANCQRGRAIQFQPVQQQPQQPVAAIQQDPRMVAAQRLLNERTATMNAILQELRNVQAVRGQNVQNLINVNRRYTDAAAAVVEAQRRVAEVRREVQLDLDQQAQARQQQAQPVQAQQQQAPPQPQGPPQRAQNRAAERERARQERERLAREAQIKAQQDRLAVVRQQQQQRQEEQRAQQRLREQQLLQLQEEQQRAQQQLTQARALKRQKSAVNNDIVMQDANAEVQRQQTRAQTVRNEAINAANLAVRQQQQRIGTRRTGRKK
ncbi:hypothetical protein HK098_007259 [Nowakowskiella sp. JEL0407]|nr:hypothetical protein HK098_007259 [Nowakowskiella sp. JEL0407]